MLERRGAASEQTARRRRAFVLIALALVCGGIAASAVSGRVAEVERRTGSLVPVVVARAELPAGRELTPERVRDALTTAEVPERYVSRDSLAAPEEAVGLRLTGPLVPGSYLTAAMLKERASAGSAGRTRGAVGPGERAIEVEAVGGLPVAPGAGGAARVDVLVTTEGGDGEGGRTYVALENVELLGARPTAGEPAVGGSAGGGSRDGGQTGGGSAAPGERTLAMLRVSSRQAVYLTAAQNFARELRLLRRPPGDKRDVAGEAIESSDL